MRGPASPSPREGSRDLAPLDVGVQALRSPSLTAALSRRPTAHGDFAVAHARPWVLCLLWAPGGLGCGARGSGWWWRLPRCPAGDQCVSQMRSMEDGPEGARGRPRSRTRLCACGLGPLDASLSSCR